jgi:DNA invertase Pin-like site-specific DNA recombinase
MITDKVRPHHLERKALLYVRQSSAHQVLHNRESSALQYAMRDRLTALGWSEIEVIDDDLGRSAAGGVQRAGFERMVAEVCLGKVGAVCAREVSRFARNSRDWQQLIEMCRVVDTVLVDQETVYPISLMSAHFVGRRTSRDCKRGYAGPGCRSEGGVGLWPTSTDLRGA